MGLAEASTGMTRTLLPDGHSFGLARGRIDFGNVLSEITVTGTRGALVADGSIRFEQTFDASHGLEGAIQMASLPAPQRAVRYHHGERHALHRSRMPERLR